MSDARKTRRGAIKAAAAARRKLHYKMQFDRASANKRRRMRRHLRAHPLDMQCSNLFERVLSYGPVALLGLCCKGKKRSKGASMIRIEK